MTEAMPSAADRDIVDHDIVDHIRFVLVRTSNPGAADLQDAGSPPLHERLAGLVNELGSDGTGESGLSFVGAVTGATEPALLARMRELMPAAVFLLPGVGAQGGRVEDLGAAFAPHPAAGLVTASRSIVGAHLQRGGDPAGPRIPVVVAEHGHGAAGRPAQHREPRGERLGVHRP